MLPQALWSLVHEQTPFTYSSNQSQFIKKTDIRLGYNGVREFPSTLLIITLSLFTNFTIFSVFEKLLMQSFHYTRVPIALLSTINFRVRLDKLVWNGAASRAGPGFNRLYEGRASYQE